MDKRVILAVAGAGKTTLIIESLCLERRALIVTYTDNNHKHLKQAVIKKFGVIPDNITVLTYFTFLYSFCYKPFLHDRVRARGINWDNPPSHTLTLKRSKQSFYIDSTRRLYYNRIAKLIKQQKIIDKVTSRLSKYFDQFFVDEVQDFGGHDFNLLLDLCSSDIEVNLVGDFYQHTFDTSRDGNLNSGLYKDYETYKDKFRTAGIIPDEKTLSNSYRCSPQICDFITKRLGINISSHKKEDSIVKPLDKTELLERYDCNETVKLFFEEQGKYDCFSENWGKSKGQDHYNDVCVMLYKKAALAFNNEQLCEKLPASSLNKLYVACTRANNNLYFAEEKWVTHLKN